MLAHIDHVYANAALLLWGGTQAAAIKAAIITKHLPLSADHRSLIVAFPGPFSMPASGGGAVITVSAVPRPVRFTMSEVVCARYKEAVMQRDSEVRCAGAQLKADVANFPELARALELLDI